MNHNNEIVNPIIEETINIIEETLEIERDLMAESLIADIQAIIDWYKEYHQNDDYLSDYFYPEHISDSLAMDNGFKTRLPEVPFELTSDMVDHVEREIIAGNISGSIRWSYMGTDEKDNEVMVCSFVIGETCEQLGDDLIERINRLEITEDEINRGIDEYYSDGCIYFNYSYDVIGLYVDKADIIEALEQYIADHDIDDNLSNWFYNEE